MLLHPRVGLESVRLTASSRQTKDFVKFLGIVIIFFCGFLTTFTLLARGNFTPGQVLWIMINVCLTTLLANSKLMMQQVLSWVRLG